MMTLLLDHKKLQEEAKVKLPAYTEYIARHHRYHTTSTVHTSTGAVSPLCLGGQHTSTLTVTITLETIAPLVAGLAIEVSPMSCHGGAVREGRSGGKGRREEGREEEGKKERKKERKGELCFNPCNYTAGEERQGKEGEEGDEGGQEEQ